jgi:Outer membrane protein beta-barrel domain
MNVRVDKKLILLVIAACSLATANAQIQFGVKAGLNLANVSVSGDNSGNSYAMKPDFHVGAFVSIPAFSSFTVQPELVFSGQGSKVTDNDPSDPSGTYNLQYLNVPVLLKYKASCGFFGETGPQFGILLSANAKQGGNSVDIKSSLKSSDFAWVFGVGYTLPVNVGFDVRYNLGLQNVSSDASNGGSIKNGVFQIGVFYLFGEGPKK